MLIKLSVSNFLSFNGVQTFSMEAGKVRKHTDRIFTKRGLKLKKFAAIFGPNASGKSNLVTTFRFVRSIIVRGLPSGSSTQYFRQAPQNENLPSVFEITLLIEDKIFNYKFSIILKTGQIQEESLEQVTTTTTKLLYSRNLTQKQFTIGNFLKGSVARQRLSLYSDDSISDNRQLFLNIMNNGKDNLYLTIPELRILKQIYSWFENSLSIYYPDEGPRGTALTTRTSLEKASSILENLGTGISSIKIVDISEDKLKNDIPNEIFADTVDALKKFARKDDRRPAILIRAHKILYVIGIDEDGSIIAKTIEFTHENKDVMFSLKEESDGTARLLDLLEILLDDTSPKTYIVDEIDRCLHPSLTVGIVDIFLSLAKTRNVQLIVTTHESRLLIADDHDGEDLLRNDEVAFVSKNDKGESILMSLEKFPIRADKKIYFSLFEGKYKGLIPIINIEDMVKQLSATKKNLVRLKKIQR